MSEALLRALPSATRALRRGALGLFAFSLVVAGLRYPGGDQLGGRDAGFSVARNYVCDLTAAVACDGRPNPGAPWARAAMLLFVAALMLFWAETALRAREVPSAIDRWSWLLGISGALTATLLAMGRPHLGGVDLHPFIILGATLPELAAVALAIVSARRAGRPGSATMAAGALLAALATATLYVAFLVMGVPSVALPMAQKVAVVAAVAWLVGAGPAPQSFGCASKKSIARRPNTNVSSSSHE